MGVPESESAFVLYGTGLRNRSSLSAVRVTVGGVRLTPFAGAQPEYPGLDQINVPLSGELAGAGEVVVEVVVDGNAANPVTLRIP
jgi:uncharacterized protein (TIGR03437 family)